MPLLEGVSSGRTRVYPKIKRHWLTTFLVRREYLNIL